MSKISYVNGSYVDHAQACVHIEDRGYQFSDGVYEVFAFKNRVVIDWDLHLKRLQNSLQGLEIEYTVRPAVLHIIITELMRRNRLYDGTIYLQITRGVAKRNHPFPIGIKPAVVIVLSQLKTPSKSAYENGVSVVSRPDIRWGRRDYKTISLLPNILAKQSAVEEKCEEAVLVKSDGIVTECSASNFFIVTKEGVVQTHPADENILNGITRIGVLGVAAQNKIKILEKPFSLLDIIDAREAFITSTTKHILPATIIDGRKIGDGKVGKITVELMGYYKKYVDEQVG